MRRLTALFLSLLLIAQARAAEVVADDQAISDFLRGVQIQNVRWTKYDGTNFTIYYCIGESPRAGVAGVYLSASEVMTEPSDRDIAIDGELGRFRVKWLRRVIKDGSRQAETVVHFAPKRWAHVLVEAPDEVGLLRFISDFGRLAIFATRPAESSFVGPGFIDTRLSARTPPE